MSTTAEKIAVMQAFERGEKVEFCQKSSGTWRVCINPVWDWYNYMYKVAPKEPRKFVRYFLCHIKTNTLASCQPYLDINAASLVCRSWNRTSGTDAYEVVGFEMTEIVNRD